MPETRDGVTYLSHGEIMHLIMLYWTGNEQATKILRRIRYDVFPKPNIRVLREWPEKKR